MRTVALSLSMIAGVLTGCNGTGTSSSATNLVASAATSATDTHAAVKSCFDTFDTCIAGAADATAVTDCQSALVACLPDDTGMQASAPDLCSDTAPPDRAACDGGGPPDGGRGPRPGEGGGAGGPGPGSGSGSDSASGSAPGPAPGPPPGDRGGGDRAGPPVSPTTRIALATCHAQLKACLAAGTDQATCVATDHQCVHDALAADFATLCADVATQCAACAAAPRCVELTARCAAGLTLPDTATGAGQ